jgi:hypothetical protein
MMPILFLASGGISLRNMVPRSLIKLLKWLDKSLSPFYEETAMFAMIVIRKM